MAPATTAIMAGILRRAIAHRQAARARNEYSGSGRTGKRGSARCCSRAKLPMLMQTVEGRETVCGWTPRQVRSVTHTKNTRLIRRLLIGAITADRVSYAFNTDANPSNKPADVTFRYHGSQCKPAQFPVLCLTASMPSPSHLDVTSKIISSHVKIPPLPGVGKYITLYAAHSRHSSLMNSWLPYLSPHSTSNLARMTTGAATTWTRRNFRLHDTFPADSMR